ncbi:outer membrane beta-barrel protein [Brachyspira intermedia]|uniref:outer membrane beta-barrel protein n=1 Tax=Brachyspira intermedia TaxID=84377 RepID=UPI003007DD8C
MKKLLFIISIFISINLSLLAASGFEGIINIPSGLSVGIPMGNSEQEVGLGFDVGVTAQFGYVIDFKNNIGLSILAETGYSYDTYSSSISSDSTKSVVSTSAFHSFQIGILPKINIYDFSIGIGGGLKIPVAGIEEEKTVTHGTNYTAAGSTVNMLDIVNKYDKMNVIPYIKLTLDYSVFNNYNVGANFGLYFDYEFGVRKKIDEIKYVSTDAFGVGLQVGLRFSPFNSRQNALDKKEQEKKE